MNIIWSKEFVYFLGFLWADGHIDRNCTRLEIVKTDMLEIISDLLTIEFIKFNQYARHRVGCKPQMQIYFCDVKLHDLFFSKYFKHKSNSSPEELLKVIPEELTRYFFNGLIDGDGNFFISKDLKTKHFSISSTYDQDWSYIRNLFEKIDISVFDERRRINKKGNSSTIRITNYDDIFKLYKYLYPNEFEIGLKRKYDKCKLMIDNKPRYTCNNKLLKKEDLTSKIDELNNIDKVCEYFDCSRKKIFNHCKKYNIIKDGFYQIQRIKRSEYLSLEESTKYMRKLKLGSKKEWVDFSKSKFRPKNIPSNPFLFYKNEGWISYGDWLGF